MRHCWLSSVTAVFDCVGILVGYFSTYCLVPTAGIFFLVWSSPVCFIRYKGGLLNLSAFSFIVIWITCFCGYYTSLKSGKCWRSGVSISKTLLCAIVCLCWSQIIFRPFWVTYVTPLIQNEEFLYSLLGLELCLMTFRLISTRNALLLSSVLKAGWQKRLTSIYRFGRTGCRWNCFLTERPIQNVREGVSEIKDRCSFMFQNNALYWFSDRIWKYCLLAEKSQRWMSERFRKRVSFRIDQLVGWSCGMYPKQFGWNAEASCLGASLGYRPEIIFFVGSRLRNGSIRKNSVFSMIIIIMTLNFTAVSLPEFRIFFYIAFIHVQCLMTGNLFFRYYVDWQRQIYALISLYAWKALIIDEITAS